MVRERVWVYRLVVAVNQRKVAQPPINIAQS